MGLKDFFDKFDFTSFNKEKRGFGLDFSDSHLRGLLVEVDSGKILLRFLERVSLPKGLIRDGKILKKEDLAEKLEGIKGEAQKIGARQFNLVVPVPDSRLYFTVFKLSAKAKKEEIEKAVQRKSENIPSVSVEESYSDYDLIPSRGDYKEVMYVSSPKKIIEDYKEVTDKVGLEVDVFEPEFLSQARAFTSFLKEKDEKVIFDCGRRTTTITIFAQSAPRYLEEIGLAGEKFTQAIASSLGVSQKRAEKLKREKGLKEEKIRKALAPVLNSMINQFTGVLEEIKKEELAPEQLLICGGGSLMPGFEDYFRKNLNLELTRPAPFSDNQIRRSSDSVTIDESEVRYSASLGASMRALNGSGSFPSINIGNK